MDERIERAQVKANMARWAWTIYLQQLQTIGKRLKGRNMVDLGEWPISIEGK